MATVDRSLRVHAPLADVWEFHARLDGLLALTPDWLHPRADHVEGDADGVLAPGSEATVSVQPFGVAPGSRGRRASRTESASTANPGSSATR